MRRILQEDSTGCGLAVIAMLSGETYEKIRSIAVNDLGWDETGSFETGTRDLRDLAGFFNIEIGKRRRPFKEFNALPNLAILAINYNEQIDDWHWVVYRRVKGDQFFLDPKKSIRTNKRRDFRRIKVKWYLPVIPYNITKEGTL